MDMREYREGLLLLSSRRGVAPELLEDADYRKAEAKRLTHKARRRARRKAKRKARR